MPTECSALLRGKVARITKVDGCGNPVRCDPNDQNSPPVHIVSDGVISIQVEPEIDEGDDITQSNWAGDSCIDDPACPKIRWVNITASFCRMDPDLFSMWTGVPVLKDPQGNATGFRIRKNVSCEEGVALEMWTGSKAVDRCIAGGKYKYGYVVIPWVVNGILGSYTIENGAVTFEVTARGIDGGGWGVGPYEVYEDASGQPAPLQRPFGTGDLEQIDTTTLPPPAAYCGANCDITPQPPAVSIVEYTADSTHMTSQLTYDNGANGPVIINWGDGSPPITTATASGTVTRQHTQSGTFTVVVTDSNYVDARAQRKITIPWGQGPPAEGAFWGAPGYFTPAGSTPPANFAGMSGITPNVTNVWSDEKYVVLGDQSAAWWSGTAWVALASGATAGSPGTWTPSGAHKPGARAALQKYKVTANPTTAWTTGQHVAASNGEQTYWNGTAWTNGVAP